MLNIANHQRNANQNCNGYRLLPVKMAIMKKITNVAEDMEKRKPSCTATGNVNLYSHYGKNYGLFSKIETSTTI